MKLKLLIYASSNRVLADLINKARHEHSDLKKHKVRGGIKMDEIGE